MNEKTSETELAKESTGEISYESEENADGIEFPEEISEENAENGLSEDASTDSESTSDITDNDLEELKEEFPELRDLGSITELANPIRYAALRDLGLSPAEAYILTSRKRMGYDNRSHLTASVPASARSPRGGMSARELSEMRLIFGDISDTEINKLYKKVTQ